MTIGIFLTDLKSAVCRTIFDQYNFNIRDGTVQYSVHTLSQCFFTIVNRYYHTYHKRPSYQNGKFLYLQSISLTYHLLVSFIGWAPAHGVFATASQYNFFNGWRQVRTQGRLVKLGV